jgi:hypothetical protein
MSPSQSLTAKGYGDLLPEFWFEKVFAIFFMPISTAALATTINRIAEISQRKKIFNSELELVADKILRTGLASGMGVAADNVAGSANDRMNEDQFVLSVLMQEGLVEKRMVDTIRMKFKHILDAHNNSSVSLYHKKDIDPELVYFHLCRQGRVVDRSRPKTKEETKLQIVRVNIDGDHGKRLPGYEEWLVHHWTGEGGRLAAKIQAIHRGRMTRASTQNLFVKAVRRVSFSLSNGLSA